jgi:hypothetical protein
MRHPRKTIAVIAWAILFMGLPGSHARAQSGDEGGGAVTPGWVFTPTVSIGASHDDNPVLAGRGSATPDDIVTSVRPGADLTLVRKHTFLGMGYRGSIQRYRTLDEYDNFAQGAYFELRHQPSRRYTLTVRDNLSVSPTTDMVEVAGVPFSRTGTQSNNLTAGLAASLTKRLQLSGDYHFQWFKFDRSEDPISSVLQGGRSHSVTVGARQSLTSRLKVGGDYTIQRANTGQPPVVGGGEPLQIPSFTIQNAMGSVGYQITPTIEVDGGAGISYLSFPGQIARTGPAAHVSLSKRTEHAFLTFSARRSFVPAFGFGGSVSNQEVLAAVRVPFARKRAYVDGSISWRDSEPVLEQELRLKSLWLKTSVGYAFQRWLRLEAFYDGTFQDTRIAGGQVDRNRIGVQVVTARPMRLN